MRRPSLKCIFSIVLTAAGSISAFAQGVYTQHNLVSDLPGVADRVDPTLQNAWGIVQVPSGIWWVNANGSGLSKVYDPTGALVPNINPVMVPAAGGGPGTPTGIVLNTTTNFQLGPSAPAIFMFGTEDGTISGWNPGVDAHNAVIKVNNSPAAVYKGIALGVMSGQTVLYAANFRGGTVDVFDTNFHPVTLPMGAFQDPQVPAGFAPFNVQNVDGDIYVTFAMQDMDKHDDVAGAGNGYVDHFSTTGTLIGRLQHGNWMNSPWAVVHAPSGFGTLSGKILVGMFGSGQIAAFDPQTGNFQGLMIGTNSMPLTINGLWGLQFSGSVLFFGAGINDEADGLFGIIASSFGRGLSIP